MTGLVAILAAIVLLVGAFLPSANIRGFGENGLYNVEAWLVIAGGLIVLCKAVIHRIKKTSSSGLAYVIIGIACIIASLLDFFHLGDGMELSVLESAGLAGTDDIAVYFPLLSILLIIPAAIFLVAAGMLERKRTNAFEYAQGPVAGFIANRVAFNRSTGQRSFSRFIIRLSTVATVISVMVMIVTLSLANGFQEKVSQKVFSFLGHLRIEEKQPDKAIISQETPIKKDDALAASIRNNPKVAAIYPFSTKYGFLKTKDEIEGVLLKGLDSTYDFNRLKEFMQEGQAIRFNDSSYSRDIIISSKTANELKLKLNDRILIYFVNVGEEAEAGTLPKLKPNKLTVAGIYKTGIEEYDKTFAICDMKLIQRLDADSTSIRTGEYKNDIGGYEIFLKDYEKTDQVAEEIYDMPEFPATWNTITAKNISPNIFDWLNMQDTTRNLLIVFMVIVAVINLITCLIILVLERIRMIGILKSLGATDCTVQRIFLRHSAWITITGIVTGTALALLLLWIQQATGFIKLEEEAYYISTAAVKIVWWQVALIGCCTFAVCFLVMMIPSLLVRKVQPVKAIQFR